MTRSTEMNTVPISGKSVDTASPPFPEMKIPHFVIAQREVKYRLLVSNAIFYWDGLVVGILRANEQFTRAESVPSWGLRVANWSNYPLTLSVPMFCYKEPVLRALWM